MKKFYIDYFQAISNEKYVNTKTNFSSYFLSFGEGQTRIELMNRPEIEQNTQHSKFLKGIAHFAFSVGSIRAVDELTERLRGDGYTIAGEPRTTSDGYYESIILDPEGNTIEITT